MLNDGSIPPCHDDMALSKRHSTLLSLFTYLLSYKKSKEAGTYTIVLFHSINFHLILSLVVSCLKKCDRYGGVGYFRVLERRKRQR